MGLSRDKNETEEITLRIVTYGQKQNLRFVCCVQSELLQLQIVSIIRLTESEMALKMSQSSPWYEMIERTQNFRWNTERIIKAAEENAAPFINLHSIKKKIIAISSMRLICEQSDSKKIKCLFTQIYDSLANQRPEYKLFSNPPSLKDKVFDACFFTALCTFLDSSKRIKGKSLRTFVEDNHPNEFGKPDSPYYRNPQEKERAIESLRKSRNRQLTTGNVYYKHSQWQAVTKDVEYEWIFYYTIDDFDDIVRDTFKRFGNLYNDINKVIDADMDHEYCENLQKAYKKFQSKLSKIKYENYFKLIKAILSHIAKNKEYYGLNIYRLERRLRPYIISEDVKKLLACQSVDEENEYLLKILVLKNIHFPKLYADFITLPLKTINWCALEFPLFLQDISAASCLILDALVEEEIFGADWEKSFLKIINEMTEKVFYRPSDIDFTVSLGSQEIFEELLRSPVLEILCYEGNMSPSDFA